jgi:hypothetical protein
VKARDDARELLSAAETRAAGIIDRRSTRPSHPERGRGAAATRASPTHSGLLVEKSSMARERTIG